jgi:FkbM family methyltransferase
MDGNVSLSDIMRKERETFSRDAFKGLFWKVAGRKLKIPSVPEHSTWYFNLGLDLVPKSIIDKLRGKTFLDVGAFWGDTALKMLELEPVTVWAFEPEENNYQLLSDVVGWNNLGDVVKPVKSGVGSKISTSFISSGGGSSKLDQLGGQKIELVTIDSFVKEKNLEIGMIKMDIEGNEHEAIMGAEHTIRSSKPVLIISLYHNGKDFFEIPPLLKSWNPDYHFRFFNAAVADLNEKLLIVY